MDNGLAGHIATKLNEYILVYGGSNFKNRYERQVHNSYYIYDKNFNLLHKSFGIIQADNGIVVNDKNKIYYFLKNEIYEIELVGYELVENKILDLEHDFNISFAVKYENRLIFGNKKVYEYNLDSKVLKELEDFIGDSRSQSVNFLHNKYIYVLGGAKNIAYLDTYRYDIEKNKWERLKDLEFSLLGASSIKYDKNSMLIMGGFDKEQYDNAVIALKDKDYKAIYFDRDRDSFNWNDKILKYNIPEQKFEVLEVSKLSRICGGTLLEIDKAYYLVMGELKPGLRSSYVYKYEVKG